MKFDFNYIHMIRNNCGCTQLFDYIGEIEIILCSYHEKSIGLIIKLFTKLNNIYLI